MSPAALPRAWLLATCLTIALATAALAQDTATLTPLGNAVPSAQVRIADTEVLPSVITVTVGAQVFWSNNTDQEIRLSDRPLGPAADSLYLPFVKGGSGSLAAAAPAPAEPAAVSWSSAPIAPSGQFSRTFAAAGTFPYYTSHLTGTVGTVVVLSDTLAATVFVDAEAGGVVEAGGSRLEIPPGALAQDATIVLSQPITGMTMPADGMQAVRLEPAGLQLNQPATLTITYGATGSYDEDLLQVVAYQASGGGWQPQPVLAQDQTAHKIALAVSRLDYWLVYIPDPLYIVLNLPAQHLKPGYMVAGLSGDACAGQSSWFPGRTAIYSGTVDATEYFAGTPKVIEALAGGAQQLGCPAGGEVRERNLDEFPELYCTLRMGALYPPGASDAQLAAAAAAAHQQIGKGYLPVGGGNWQPGCFSSTGLVEYAYRQAGIGVVPPALEGWPITPLQLARKLRPVEELTVQPEQLLSLRAELIYWEANATGGGN